MSDEKEPSGESPEFAPVGTWALLCLVAVGMVAAWLFLYFGVFLPRGPIQ
jgi:hypothetical protein